MKRHNIKTAWIMFSTLVLPCMGSLACTTCHSAHASASTASQLRVAADGTCRQCHVEAVQMYDGSPMAKAGVSCTACHMAKIANRAGSTKKNKEHWDVSGHTFAVVMPYEAESWKMRSSCDACHVGEEKAKYGEAIMQRGREVRAKIDEVYRVMEKKQKSTGSLKAGNGVSTVFLDGSKGAHHYRKTMDLISRALKDASGK
jgi:predicted CXXCH cytochrome family protein